MRKRCAKACTWLMDTWLGLVLFMFVVSMFWLSFVFVIVAFSHPDIWGKFWIVPAGSAIVSLLFGLSALGERSRTSGRAEKNRGLSDGTFHDRTHCVDDL